MLSWCCWTPSKKDVFSCTRIHLQRIHLSNDCVSVSSHAFWRVLSNKVNWVFGCWVNIPHTHTSERHSLLFEGCLRPTVTVTPSDLNSVNESNSLQRFWLIHTSTITSMILRIRTTGTCAPGSHRMKLLKTVATWLDRYYAGSQGGGAKKRPGNGDE